MKILECSTRGDKRFSAFGAYITINGRTDCIENIYQCSKRTKDGDIAGKGRPFSYFICPFCGLKFPKEDVSDLYKGLWIVYFNEHPELLEYASEFDGYNDMFRGRSTNCQADVVREMVADKETFIDNVKSGHWYIAMSESIIAKNDL